MPFVACIPAVAQFQNDFESAQNPLPVWALEETFTSSPTSPSQSALPANFDFAVTHRTHPRDHQPEFPAYPADHALDCAGPPLQHSVVTSHLSNSTFPDQSFFVCKNHMMSALGDVSGYSVSVFWPRQIFDFRAGGQLEFDVNINDDHPRSWWEILITPREQLRIGAARDWLPIDETYPQDRIVLDFSANSRRSITVGTGLVAPDGWVVNEQDGADWRDWRYIAPTDPALDDRRIRRKMRITFDTNTISWAIELPTGDFDTFTVNVPGGLPFRQGLVVFKTHAYTPTKDDNFTEYTYHWDTIRFSGPVTGRYSAVEINELVYLQNNGNRPIGDQHTITFDWPAHLPNPILSGQLHGALSGQVLLSVNDQPLQSVHPLHYSDNSDCTTSGWSTFHLALDPAHLKVGTNILTWKVGPRPTCAASGLWDGFSVKNLEVQFDL